MPVSVLTNVVIISCIHSAIITSTSQHFHISNGFGFQTTNLKITTITSLFFSVKLSSSPRVSIMNAASGTSSHTRSRGKTELRKKSSSSHSKKRSADDVIATPKLNSTADFFFSLILLSITPLVLMLNYIFDKVSFSHKNQRNGVPNLQNVSAVDTESDGVLLKLNHTVSSFVTIHATICSCRLLNIIVPIPMVD